METIKKIIQKIISMILLDLNSTYLRPKSALSSLYKTTQNWRQTTT